MLEKRTTAAGGERVLAVRTANTRSPPEFARGSLILIAIVIAGKLLWVAVKRGAAGGGLRLAARLQQRMESMQQQLDELRESVEGLPSELVTQRISH